MMSDQEGMRVALKSAYSPYEPADGARYLAETLWPEGVDTQKLSPYLWVHELAPSYAMQELSLWQEWGVERFREEYRQELQEPRRRAWFNLVFDEARKKGVTLLHHSDKKESQIGPEDTSVYYLKEFMEEEFNARDRQFRLRAVAGSAGSVKSKGV